MIGQNVQIETRWATANDGEIRKNAAELFALKPDVILAHGSSTLGTLPTRTIPFVFPVAGDPVAGATRSRCRLLCSSAFHRLLLRKGRNRKSAGGEPVCKLSCEEWCRGRCPRPRAKTYVSLNVRLTADWLAWSEEPVPRNISCVTV